MELCFSKFEFTKKTSAKFFYKYRIINKNPYNPKAEYIGMSVKNTITNIRENKKRGLMFVYAHNNEYIYTFEEIIKFPESTDYEIEYVSHEEIPLTEVFLELYQEWIQYYVYHTIVSYCSDNKNAFDYRRINKYSMLLDTPANSLGVTLKRVFNVKAEVLTDGTAYLNVDFKCEFDSKNNVYDLIMDGKDVINLEVKCTWQGYDKCYTVTKVYKENISEDINGFNLLEYWEKKRDCRKLDLNAPAVGVYDLSRKSESLYMPQSLTPIITRSYIAENDKSLSRLVDKYTKLSMNKRLEIIKNDFLNVLNHKSQIIKTVPLTVEKFDFYKMDCSENMPGLMIGNNNRISFTQKWQAFSKGFYKLPEKPVVAAFLSYESERKQSHDVVKGIHEFSKTAISSDGSALLPIKFFPEAFLYKKGDSLSYKEVASKIKDHDDINFVISALPLEYDEEEYFDEKNSPYDNFKRILADISLPSQMVSNSMSRDIDNKYRMQNIILGILSKAGGVPWVLDSDLDDIDCFIGLDVGTQEKGIHYPACSVCLDGQGNLVAYYSTNVAQKGEKINTDTLNNIFDNILLKYKEVNDAYPKHIVVHRDGFSNEECEWYKHYFEPKGIEFDIIEIRKNIPVRIMQTDNKTDEGNPKAGCAIIKGNEAYLISTNVKPYLGAPRPLLLEHKYGNLSMESITRQVYILSEMHGGSMRTSRLPITTLYADKICKAHDYVPHDKLSDSLYFL